MTDSKDTSTQALPTPGAGPRMLHVPLTAIAPSLTNPRKHFDQAKLQELADSIKASGVHQPILLRPLPTHRLEDTLHTARAKKQAAPEYELVAGERRWRASQMAGLTEIPALIRPMTDAQALKAQIIENLQREDVTELEEAESYRALMDSEGSSADAIAAEVGRSRSYIFARLKVLDLCEHGRQLLRDGKLDFSCALPIARIPNEQLQLKALEEATDTDYQGDRMSAREVQAMVRSQFMTKLEYASFDLEDASLCPLAGACTSCPHRTGNNPDLQAVVDSADVCTNPPCYHAKEEAHKAQVRERAVASGCEIITGREAKALIPTAYTSSIEGHVRLDVATDSPIKGKPLRAVVGKAMEQAGIKPTLIENPHTKELVAVVRKDQAAELLKMAGKAEAEAKVRKEQAEDAEAAQRQAEKDAQVRYEKEWRSALATQLIQYICKGNVNDATDTACEAAVASHMLGTLNKDDAAQLAKILELGKVAPIDALKDYASAHPVPVVAAAAVLVLRDAGYAPWLPEGYAKNTLLLSLAQTAHIDVETLKSNVQANIRAELDAAKQLKAAASPDKSEAPKANTPLPPAAHTQKGVGGGKAKGKSQQGPAALAGGGGKKLSANAAAASIAAALQALPGEPELGAAAAAQGNVAEPVATEVAQALPPSAGITFATEKTIREQTPAAAGTGESVNDGQDGAAAKTGAAAKKAKAVLSAAELVGKVVRINANATQKKQKPWVDYEGSVTAQCGPEAVIVSIPRAKGCAPIILSFHVSELDLVAEQEAA